MVGPWKLFNLGQRQELGPERCPVVAESLEPVVAPKDLSLNPTSTPLLLLAAGWARGADYHPKAPAFLRQT